MVIQAVVDEGDGRFTELINIQVVYISAAQDNEFAQSWTICNKGSSILSPIPGYQGICSELIFCVSIKTYRYQVNTF